MANNRTGPDNSTTPIVAPIVRWLPVPNSYGQAAVTAAAQGLAALGIAVPIDAVMCEINAEGAGVRYLDDGQVPTATFGMPLYNGQQFQYSPQDFTRIQFIQQAAGAKINVAWYR
jgi:hypothetical protein